MTNTDTSRYVAADDDKDITIEMYVGKIPTQKVHPGTIEYLVISKDTFEMTNATYKAQNVLSGNTYDDLWTWITFSPTQRKFDFHATQKELDNNVTGQVIVWAYN